MSGTRKMGRFELDEPEREPVPPEPASEPSVRLAHPPVRPPPSGPERTDEPSVLVEEPPAVDPAALRTRLTKKFVSLAEEVTEAFAELSIGGGAWAAELAAPTGMSTGGGKQALAPLRLRPRRPGYAAIVGGLVNQVDKRAELRDFVYVCVLHEIRFRRHLEITHDEWEQFLRTAEVALWKVGISCQRVGPPPDLVHRRKNLTRVSRVAAAALVIVLVLAAIVAWRVVVTSST